MKKLWYVFVLVGLLFGLVSPAVAKPVHEEGGTVVEAKIYDAEGQEDPSTLTTSLSFTILFVAYPAGENESIKIEVSGITDEMDAVLHTGPGLSDGYTYEDGTITWEGALNPVGSSEVWIEIPNNYWFLDTMTFPSTVSGNNMQPGFYEFSVINPDEPPMPVVELETWVIDALNTANPDGLITSEDFTTLGIVYVQALNQPTIPFTATMQGYPTESRPVFSTNENVVVTDQTWEGDTLTVVGTMTTGLGVANELMVHVDNIFYLSTHYFTISVVVEGADGVDRTLWVTNPDNPPVVIYHRLMPLVMKNFRPARLELPLTLVTTVGGTSEYPVANLAIYPRVMDFSTEVTVTFGITEDPYWNSRMYVASYLVGEPVYSANGEWSWTGTLRQGVDIPSEFWVTFGSLLPPGTYSFTWTISAVGYDTLTAPITLTKTLTKN